MQKTFPNPARLLGLLMVFLVGTFGAFAQSAVSGVVQDASGEPLIGATVLVKGTQTATSTNIDGEFTLQANPDATLVVSYIGYKTVEAPARNGMEVTLEEDNNILDEVVVIGYGSVKRKDVTTAISTISSKDLENRPIVSAAQALQGKAAGVSVTSPNGAPAER